MNVRQYAGSDPLFLAACELAKVRRTYRQWRKWNQGRGLASQHKQRAAQQLASAS